MAKENLKTDVEETTLEEVEEIESNVEDNLTDEDTDSLFDDDD